MADASPLFSQFQVNCIELLKTMPAVQSRHCFRSALRHLAFAHDIREIDPAMAIFRCITAEEEAASGLMWALKELKYVGAKQLNPRNHVHKHAAIPFLKVISLFFGQSFAHLLKDYRLHIKEEEGARRLMLTFRVTKDGEENWLYPLPPLNFGAHMEKTGLPPSYKTQVSQYVDAKGEKSIHSYLKKEANLRNEILYAGPDGYPIVDQLKPGFIKEKAGNVMTLLQAYLLIRPYKEIQPYVQDALTAFLTAVVVGMKLPPEDVANDGFESTV